MLRLTLKNLRANKVRFALTTFGVMLAVSFVVSAFVLGDGLRSTFGGVADEITAGIDLEVRPEADFGDPPPLSADLVGVVAGVDGVADAVPTVEAGWDVVGVFMRSGVSGQTTRPAIEAPATSSCTVPRSCCPSPTIPPFRPSCGRKCCAGRVHDSRRR